MGEQLMSAAAKKVEEKIQRTPNPDSREIPTWINDELYANCATVAVCHAAGNGASFRGLECTQFEIAGQLYNMAITRK